MESHYEIYIMSYNSRNLRELSSTLTMEMPKGMLSMTLSKTRKRKFC